MDFSADVYDMGPALRAPRVPPTGPPRAVQGITVSEEACALWERVPRYVDLGLSESGVIRVCPGALRRFIDGNGVYQFLATHLDALLPDRDGEGCCHACVVHPCDDAFYIDTKNVLYRPDYTGQDQQYIERLGWAYTQERRKCFHRFFADLPRSARLAFLREEIESGDPLKFERSKAALTRMDENPHNLKGVELALWRARFLPEITQDYYGSTPELLRAVV